jgi:protein-disulfide isomerase
MPKEKQQSDEIVINLDSLAVPGAIILAGIIIAVTIFFTSRGGNDSILGNIDTNNPAQQVEEEEFRDTETKIRNSPYLGDKGKAKIAIVEYTDYLCPYCQRHSDDTMKALIDEYVDTGKAIYVFKKYPLEFYGQLSVDAANATLCVNEIAGIDTFLSFHSDVFLVSSTDELSSAASKLGVDMDKYNACMQENRYEKEIYESMEDGVQAGVQGTPGFVVGILSEDGTVKGKLIAGAYPFEYFKSIIDDLLK